MSNNQEETPVMENRIPLELTSKPEEVFEITGKELAAFFQAQKLFFEFSFQAEPNQRNRVGFRKLVLPS